jgi:hypothetical protein
VPNFQEDIMTRCSLLFTFAILAFSMPALAAAPANDAIKRAVLANSLPFVRVLDTTDATTAFRDPQCAGQGPTVWFEYRSNADRWIEANTFGSEFDSTLSVYTRAQGNTLVQLACNDDADGLQSQVRFHAQPGVTYLFMVGSFASGSGGPLRFLVDAAPNQADLALDLRVTSAVLNSTGAVTLQGTVTCSRPQSGYVSGQIVQKRGNGEVGAFFGAEVLCDGTGRWTTTSSRPRPLRGGGPGAAVFTRARLFVSGRVSTWDETTGEVSEGDVMAALRLR